MSRFIDALDAHLVNEFSASQREQWEEMASMADPLRTVERAAETNILLEVYLARVDVGDGGRATDAPPAAGGPL